MFVTLNRRGCSGGYLPLISLTLLAFAALGAYVGRLSGLTDADYRPATRPNVSPRSPACKNEFPWPKAQRFRKISLPSEEELRQNPGMRGALREYYGDLPPEK